MAEHPAAALKAIPFEELLAGFLGPAREEFIHEAAGATALLHAGCVEVLEYALRQYLAGFALPAFYQEFALFRALRRPLPWVTAAHSTETYSEFCASWSAELLAREYPELPVLLRSWASGWARSHAALVRRAAADWPILRRLAHSPGATAAIGAVIPYCSDPHQDGQSVAILTASGSEAAGRVVYKPRSLRLEAWFYGVLAWANHHGFSCPYRIPAIEVRPGYGWMEFIPPAPCLAVAEVENFYRRAGGLLLLTALLQGTDLHRENLIAHGDQPVLVDLETLLHPRPLSSGLDLVDTLPDTGLLARAGQPNGPDFSALGPGEPLSTTFPAFTCTAPNTDQMSFQYGQYQAPGRPNAPTLRNCAQSVARYAGALADGFREMFDLVIRHRRELVATGGPIPLAAAATGRRVIRSSNTYGLLMQRSLEPVHLSAPGSRRRFFEQSLPGACAEEIQALTSMNVPYLTGPCQTAAEQAAQRLSKLTRDDWKPCVQMIRAALRSADLDASAAGR